MSTLGAQTRLQKTRLPGPKNSRETKGFEVQSSHIVLHLSLAVVGDIL